MSTVWFRVGFDLNFVCHHRRRPVVPLLYLVTHDRQFRYPSSAPPLPLSFVAPSSSAAPTPYRPFRSSLLDGTRSGDSIILPRRRPLLHGVLPPWNTRTFEITDSVTYVRARIYTYARAHTHQLRSFTRSRPFLAPDSDVGLLNAHRFRVRAMYPPCFDVLRAIISFCRLIPPASLTLSFPPLSLSLYLIHSRHRRFVSETTRGLVLPLINRVTQTSRNFVARGRSH